MKVVILAGGLGTRLAEESQTRPKPMVEIGGKPILWHIMKLYSHQGFNEFIICCGYKGYMIKEYFANYYLHMSDVTFDLARNEIKVHQNSAEPWKVTLVDTGDNSLTGGRIRRIRDYVNVEDFCMTYGDGVSDVDLKKALAFHREQKTWATVTATQPPGRFGVLEIEGSKVTNFREKPRGDHNWINGGFFFLSPKVFDFIDDDLSIWEKKPMEELAKRGQLSAYQHDGFWQPMDTLRDKIYLEELWQSGRAPWKIW